MSYFVALLPKSRLLLLFVFSISFLSIPCLAQKYVLPNNGMEVYDHPTPVLGEIGDLLDSKNQENYNRAYRLIETLETDFLQKELKTSADTITYIVSQEYKASLYTSELKTEKALEQCELIKQLLDDWEITNNILIAKYYSVLSHIYARMDEESQAKCANAADAALEAYLKGPYQSVFLYKAITSNKYRAYVSSSAPGATDSTLKYLDIRKALLKDYGHYYVSPENNQNSLYLGYAQFYASSGDFSKAISYGMELMRIMDAQEKRDLTFDGFYEENLFWLCVNYYYNKQYKESLYHTEHLVDLAKKRLSPDDYTMIQYYNLMGINYEGLDEFDSAMTWYNICRDILENQGIKNSIYAGLLLNISSVEARKGDFRSSELHLQQGLKLNKRIFGEAHAEHSPFYLYFFEHYSMAGDQEKALVYIDSALTSLEPSHTGGFLSNPKLESNLVSFETLDVLHSQMLQQMAVYKERPADRKEYLHAVVSRAEVIQKVLDDKRNTLYESESVLLHSEWFKSAYETVLEALYLLYEESQNPKFLDQAMAYLTSGKSRLLVDEMGEFRLVNNNSIPDSVRIGFIEAKRAVARLDNHLNELFAKSIDSDSIRVLNKQKFFWNNEYNRIKQHLKKEYQPTDLLLSPVSDLDKIKDLYHPANNDEVILEYFVGDHSITTLAVSKTEKKLFHIPRDSAFDQTLNTFLEQIGTKINPSVDELNQFQDRAHSLYEKLLSPVVDAFDTEVSRMTIIADDKLNLLPFELLVTKKQDDLTSFKQAHYLIHDYIISYQLSASNMQTGTLARNRKGILAFGYDGEGIADERSGLGGLPGAVAEVEFLRSNFTGTFYSGNSGDKRRFLEKAKDYDVLHLALHGKADLNNRFNSSLIFNGDTDYSLNTYDLYGIRLNPRMVVLSACESGVGKLSTAEGSFSVARGFASVGVPSIVTTLWKVNDQIGADIVKKFYENLKAGLSKDEALQKAKLTFLESSDSNTSSPYFWGSFIVIGDTSPIDLKKSGNLTQYLALVLLLALVASFILIKRRKGQNS
ncbi:MAG: CHAT domain-containing protein [Roseivirga sp.]|nr:CHAT domain-containing protein [Roseivirga sp.]